MKNSASRDNEAPVRANAAKAQENQLDHAMVADLEDQIKADFMAGKTVSPMDYEGDRRLLFWAAIAGVRDGLPGVRAGWKTVQEHHVDGTRLRQRVYRLQAGMIDPQVVLALATGALLTAFGIVIGAWI